MKKLTAFILAIILAFSVLCVNGFAFTESEDRPFIGLYNDSEDNLLLVVDKKYSKRQLKFYEVDSEENCIPLEGIPESFTELNFLNCYTVISDGIFVPEGKYMLEVTEEGTAEPQKYYYSYESFFECNPILKEEYVYIHEGETYDLKDALLIPVGYNKEINFDLYFDDGEIHEGESITDSYAVVDGNILTAVDDIRISVTVRFDSYNNNHTFYEFYTLEILKTPPKNFFELLKNTFETLLEGYFLPIFEFLFGM